MSSSSSPSPSPRVGIALFLHRPNSTFLLGRRKSNPGSGTLALPGGKLEYGETFTACAVREAREETGLVVLEDSLRVLGVVNSVFHGEGVHFVSVILGGLVGADAEAKTMEPDKCEGWEWVSWARVCEYADATTTRTMEVDGRTSESAEGILFLPLLDFVKQGFDPWMKMRESLGSR